MPVRLHTVPFFVILMGIGAAAMLVPAFHALVLRDMAVARSFFFSAILFLVVVALVALATAPRRARRRGRGHLLTLGAAYGVLPLMLAVPVAEATGAFSFPNAYFEMVSSLTTTGGRFFTNPEDVPQSVHLWRALVGWMGGFFVWVTAIAVLSPLNLGGFEVESSGGVGHGTLGSPITEVADTAERLRRFAMALAPVYGGLTLLLWTLLIIAGESPFVAACHAMSVLATSGISPVGGAHMGLAGVPGEALMLPFFVFAVSRLTFTFDTRHRALRRFAADPEVRLAAVLVVALPTLLFLRHFAVAPTTPQSVLEGFRAFWGALFTVASFLTTTGFHSAQWGGVQAWSGLSAPGLLLIGLALIGGGVATTAGGMKLLRVYALYSHGMRELERLVHPSSVGGAASGARRLRRQGAFVAWIFFMLFAMSIAVVMLALALAGASFDEAMVLAVSALANTGPLADLASAGAIRYVDLDDAAKIIVAAAMVLGRLEALAVIALLNPDYWRR